MNVIVIVSLYMLTTADGGLSKTQKSGSSSLRFHFPWAGENEFYGGRLDIVDEIDVQAGLGPVKGTFFFMSDLAAQVIHPGESFTIRYLPPWVVGFGFIQSVLFQVGDRWTVDSCEIDQKSGWLMSPVYFTQSVGKGGNYSGDSFTSKRNPWDTVESTLPWHGLVARVSYDHGSGPILEDEDGYGPKHCFTRSEKQFTGIHFFRKSVGEDREVVIKFPPWDDPKQVQVGDAFDIREGDDVVGRGFVTGILL